MDAVFAESGLELTSVAHLSHSALALATGDEEECLRHNTAAAELAWAEGNPRWAALCIGLQANMLVMLDRLEEGIARAEQAIAIGREHGGWVVPAEVARAIALSQMDREHALAPLERAWQFASEQGNEPMSVSAGTVLADLLMSNGDRERGLTVHGVLVERTSESRNHILGYLTCISLGASLVPEDAESAAVLLGGAAVFDRVARGHRRRTMEEALEQSRARLGDDTFQRATARGRAMTIEELLTFASTTLSRLLSEPPVKE
jgi:hypothetical protein